MAVATKLWDLPQDVFLSHVLPACSLLDLQSLLRASPTISRFACACIEESLPAETSPPADVVVASAMLLWDSSTRSEPLQRLHFDTLLPSLHAYASEIARRGRCISDTLLHVAASHWWASPRSRLPVAPPAAGRTRFDSLLPLLTRLPPPAGGALLFSVLSAGERASLSPSAHEVCLLVHAYSSSVDHCLSSTVSLTASFLALCLSPPRAPPSRRPRRKRRRARADASALDGACVLTSLSLAWHPATSSLVLRSLAASAGSRAADGLLVGVHFLAGYGTAAGILAFFDAGGAGEVIGRIRAANQLGPAAVAAYVTAVSAAWVPAEKERLREKVRGRYHSEARERFDRFVEALEVQAKRQCAA